MMCVRLLTVFCALLTCRGVWGDQWAPGMFGTQSHDFGTIAAGAKAQFSFVVTNNYAKEVHIAAARSSCGCSDVRIDKPTLQTYETGAIVASINSRRLRGRQVRHDHRRVRPTGLCRGAASGRCVHSRRRRFIARQHRVRGASSGKAGRETSDGDTLRKPRLEAAGSRLRAPQRKRLVRGNCARSRRYPIV